MSPCSHVADLSPSFPATCMQKKVVTSIFQVEVKPPLSILQKAIYDLINSRVYISSVRSCTRVDFGEITGNRIYRDIHLNSWNGNYYAFIMKGRRILGLLP